MSLRIKFIYMCITNEFTDTQAQYKSIAAYRIAKSPQNRQEAPQGANEYQSALDRD